jgi:hypothetical protein
LRNALGSSSGRPSDAELNFMNPLVGIRAIILSAAFGVAATAALGLAAGTGAFCGALLASTGRFFRIPALGRSWRLDFLFLGASVLALLASLAPLAAGSASIATLVPNFLPSVLISILFCGLLLEGSRRFPALRLAECLVVGFFFCVPLLASSGGQFTRPQWLGDWGMERNLGLSGLLAFAGVLAAILSLSILIFDRGEKGGWKLALPAFFGAGFLIALGCLCAWLVFELSGPVKSQSLPPPPPVSFSGDPPPPPPPQPEALAAIQFSKVHQPSKRLGGYFFRKNDPFTEAPEGGEIVEAKVFYLDGALAPLGLAGRSKFSPLPVPGRRFQKAELVTTLVPLSSESSDVDSKKVRKICELELASANATEGPAEVTGIFSKVRAVMEGSEKVPVGGFLEEVQSAIKTKPERMESRALLALTVTDWIEQNGDFTSGDQPPEPVEVVEFVKNGMKGSSGDFARLADAIFRLAGIPSRVVEGFFHPVEAVPLDRLILTDSHRETWVEVLTAKGDWIILPIRPAKVSEREPPPPQEDLKQQIFDEIEKEVSETPADSLASVPTAPKRAPVWWIAPAVILACLFVWMLITVFALPIHRILSVPDEHAHRQALAESARRAARFFRDREFGESWSGFSKNMEPSLPGHARRFQKFLEFHHRVEGANWNPPMNLEAAIIHATGRKAALAYSLFAASTLFLPEKFFRKKNQSTINPPKS